MHPSSLSPRSFFWTLCACCGSRCTRLLSDIVKMFSSLVWLVAMLFPVIRSHESLSLSGYENATAVEALVAKLQSELVPQAISYPMQTFHMPPHARKKTLAHTGETVSSNPAAVLGRQSCTGGANNYCFANNPNSWCGDCGICCTAPSGGWCCASSGEFCCASGNSCCHDGETCRSDGYCVFPVCVISQQVKRIEKRRGTDKTSVTVTSTYTSWATVYDYVTQYKQYIQTLYQTVTITSSTTLVVPAIGGKAKMVKRTSASDEETQDCGPTATHKASLSYVPTYVDKASEILTATIPSYPRYDIVELKLQQMGLLVKRAPTVTATITVTTSATTTQISSVFVTTTSVTTGITTVTALVTFTTTSNVPAGSKPSQSGISDPVDNPNPTTDQNSASGLSTGAKAGIGVASAAGSAIICILIIFWWRRRSKKNESADAAAAAAAGSASPTPGMLYEPKYQTTPQSQSPSHNQYAQMYPQQHQNQGAGGGYPPYPQGYQQYPQNGGGYGQGYGQRGGWGHVPMSPTSGPDPSAMPFEVGGQPMFPSEMPPPVVHEMSQPSPIMRVASPVRKPVGGGVVRLGSL